MSHFTYTTPLPPLSSSLVPLMSTPENLQSYLEKFPEHRRLFPKHFFVVDLTQDYYPVEGYCPAEVPRLDLSDLRVVRQLQYFKVDFVNGREVIDLTGDDFNVYYVNGREVIDLTE